MPIEMWTGLRSWRLHLNEEKVKGRFAKNICLRYDTGRWGSGSIAGRKVTGMTYPVEFSKFLEVNYGQNLDCGR